MQDESMMQDDAVETFKLRVVHALEVQPGVNVPADFASRVAAKVPARRKFLAQQVELRTTRYGYRVLEVCAVILLFAMLALAPRAVASSALWTGIEWTLCAQFLALAMWFGWRQNRMQ